MPKTKVQKKEIIDSLTEDLKSQKSVVFIDHSGLKINFMNDLRKKIKQDKGKFQATKKSLLNLVAKKAGFDLSKDLTGQIAIVIGLEDAILPIKDVYEISKKAENLRIIAGIFEGKIIPKEEVMAIAQLPSKKELLAKLVGSIASPMSGLLNAFQGNTRSLVYILSNIKK